MNNLDLKSEEPPRIPDPEPEVPSELPETVGDAYKLGFADGLKAGKSWLARVNGSRKTAKKAESCRKNGFQKGHKYAGKKKAVGNE